MVDNTRFNRFNDVANPMGIPPYDHIVNTYDGSSNLLTATYYRGGSGGVVVARLVMTYDGSGNVLTVDREI